MSASKIRHAVNRVIGEMAAAAAPEAGSALDALEPELDAYSELILAPRRSAVGFMTRGQGSSFTERVRAILRGLDMPPQAIAHHGFLAALFEHKRAFFKLEWHFDENGGHQPVAACYFRRRPELETLLGEFQARGIATELHDELRLLAYHLDKRTVHFVAAGFRRGSAVHHKLYFSQYLTGHTRADVDARLARAVQRTGLRPALLALWRRVHPAMIAQDGDSTLFVSVNLVDAGRLPWIKIDYPGVPPSAAALWRPAGEREQVMRDAQAACAVVGASRLSYLGVRLGEGRDHATIKYYADFPDHGLLSGA